MNLGKGFLNGKKTGIVVGATVVYCGLGWGLGHMELQHCVGLLSGVGIVGALISRVTRLIEKYGGSLEEILKLAGRR